MKTIKNFIEHKWFERSVIWLIIFSWIIMWLETSQVISTKFWWLLAIIDIIIISLFTLEALLKIIVYKAKYFKNWWNLFDFTVVVISLIPTSGPFEILRIFRVFRLLRLITVIPSMRKIVAALLWVIPWILSVSALLMIIFYVFAILVTQLYGSAFPEWFWDLWASFYTLFQIMTLESWSMWIVRPVMEIYPYSWIVFVTFVLIATFVMVNLVIAIVVEAMNKITKDEEEHIIDSIQTAQNVTKQDIQQLEKQIQQLTELVKQKNK